MSQPDAAARDRMIVGAMRSGMTREEASVLTDVSKHAFEEAMTTVQRIIETAPTDGIKIAAFASVLASFATVMREKLPAHWSALVGAKTTVGESAVIILPERRADR